MKYTKFIIKNYKGIPSIELDLSKKPSLNIFTLVGLNESGKTSILEAIYLFQNDILKEESHTLIPKSRQYSFNETISIEAELELEDGELNSIKKYLLENYKFQLIEAQKIIKVEKKYNFERSVPLASEEWKKFLWTLPFVGKTKQAKTPKKLFDWKKEAWDDIIELIRKKHLPKILYYQDFLFKFPEKIYLEPFEKEGAEQEEYRGVIQDILGSIENGLSAEKDLLERMKHKDEKSHKEALDQLLLKMSSKLDDEILKKWDEIFEGTQKKSVNVSCGDEADGTGNTKHFIELKIKQGSDSYSINDRSLGFRWFFSFLIFTAFRKSRSSDPGETLFLLDEPASNLHQRSQQKLLQSLENIVSDCKLVYSTHSHHLINPKWLAGTYIVRNKAINYNNPEEADTTETEINAILYKNFVSKYPNEVDHFKPILDALQYTPSKLEIVPSTIFTEGKNDYYIFKYVSEVFFKNESDLHFYPGAGVDKYDDPFRLYLAWDRNFIALFDSDKGGNDARDRYVKDIGPDIENKIFILQDVNKAWKKLETEDLFSEPEKIKIIQHCFENHDKKSVYVKSKFNTAIQELYIRKEKFELNKTTLDKFKKIFEFLAKKLDNLK
jgi:hypothetical protein